MGQLVEIDLQDWFANYYYDDVFVVGNVIEMLVFQFVFEKDESRKNAQKEIDLIL